MKTIRHSRTRLTIWQRFSCMNQLQLINAQSAVLRVVLLVAVLCAAAGAWVAGRWFFANVFAEVVPAAGEKGRDTLLWAQQAAPRDPLTHQALGRVDKRSLDPAAQRRAVQHYEEAARLSPYDYRIWGELGLARQQTEDLDGAEKALRRCVALAPHYAEPRWFLGNFLLRAGRYDEAFAELQRAADGNAEYRPQFFNAVWQVSGQDLNTLQRAAGPTPGARADLAQFLLSQQRADAALNVWNSLQPQEKQQFAALGESMLRGFIEAQKYHAAVTVAQGLAAAPDAAPVVGSITNGGFEDAPRNGPFDWQANSVAQVQTGTDTARKHSGNNSLRVNFKVTKNLDWANVGQLVAVAAGGRYRLEFFVRTDSLKSAGPPVVRVLDAGTGQVLASSPPLGQGTNKDWQPVSVPFAARGEGVIIRLTRETCGNEATCPIFGTIWFDDFKLVP
jgi:tetratricopeptide (TPR) repeat protein